MDNHRQSVSITSITAIRVVPDGKAFVPQQAVSLPDQSEATVLIEQNDAQADVLLNAAIRAYYENATDAEDEQWAAATSPQSQRAWDGE